MKKHLIYSLISLIFVGCAEQNDFAEPVETLDVSKTMSEIRTRALTNAVYNEVLETWMFPQKDPYSLGNFQKAYDKLKSGKSTQKLSKTQVAEFAVAKKLYPTHYALKIYPHNEEEQWCVEMMEDVQVSYHPFDYGLLSPEEIGKLPQARAKSAINTFTEKNPYTITYEGFETVGGDSVESQTSQLPILYTVWPIDKPLPDDMEYVIDYEVFLPRAATQIVGAIDVLENEAVSAVLGISSLPIRATVTRTGYGTVTGTLKTYDNSLGIYVPVPNITVYYWSGAPNGGTNSMETSTDSSGNFSLDLFSMSLSNLSMGFRFQDPRGRWKITHATHTSPLVTGDGNYEAPGGRWKPGVTSLGDVILFPASSNEIHRAANYYFDQQTSFPKYSYSGGLRIMAYSSDESRNLNWNGLFTYSSLNTCYISIRNLGYYNPDSDEPGGYVQHKDVIGTTLHELGHYIHWNERGKYNGFKVVSRLLQESFASYSGWHLGQEFYQSLGWVHPGGNPSISSAQARQTSWRKTVTSDWKYYSPLFIDLADNYNQQTYYGLSYPQDEIKNVPASVIWNIVSNSPTWADCRSKIVSHVGTQYCTSTQLSTWLSEFDTWFANPANQ